MLPRNNAPLKHHAHFKPFICRISLTGTDNGSIVIVVIIMHRPIRMSRVDGLLVLEGCAVGLV